LFRDQRRAPKRIPVAARAAPVLPIMRRMPILRKAPPQEEVALALGQLLSAAGVAEAAQQKDVSAAAGTRRPAYHLLTSAYLQNRRAKFLHVLARPFSTQYSGWFIHLREARAIFEAAHRLAKARKR